jgi:hypothetical protein
VIHNIYANFLYNYFFKQYFSILAFFFDEESSFTHALSFNNPITTSNTFFTPLCNNLYFLDSLFKVSSENLMLNGNLLPYEIFSEM